MSSISRNQLIDHLLYLGQMESTETAHFHQLAAAQHGLSITDSKTISVLLQEGSMTAGQLATRLALTSGAVTSVIDRLEAARLVSRVTDPSDRRKVIVQLNHRQAAHLGGTYESIGRAFANLLQDYSTEQLQFLTTYYESSIDLTKQEVSRLRTGA